MLKAILTLFICLDAGDLINRASGLPLPGAVIGLILLLGFLIWRGGPDEHLKMTSHVLLQNMTILFVPACVGVITQLSSLQQNAFPILVATVISTSLGMAATAFIMHWLAQGREE